LKNFEISALLSHQQHFLEFSLTFCLDWTNTKRPRLGN